MKKIAIITRFIYCTDCSLAAAAMYSEAGTVYMPDMAYSRAI